MTPTPDLHAPFVVYPGNMTGQDCVDRVVTPCALAFDTSGLQTQGARHDIEKAKPVVRIERLDKHAEEWPDADDRTREALPSGPGVATVAVLASAPVAVLAFLGALIVGQGLLSALGLALLSQVGVVVVVVLSAAIALRS
ncbi:hypothetical protein [Rhodosalinus sp.]|uniref:hypothetical protein n=1 Tax=Rhodosalinus sp. TaxID=2047741 RepID=UPI003561EFB3